MTVHRLRMRVLRIVNDRLHYEKDTYQPAFLRRALAFASCEALDAPRELTRFGSGAIGAVRTTT